MHNLPTEEQPASCPEVADRELEALACASPTRRAAVADLLKERRHQVINGHRSQQDAAHPLGALSQAAMATIAAADDAGPRGALFAEAFWPFDYRDRPKADVGRRRLLVKAMALLLAELERLPRADADALPPTRTVLLLPTGNEGGAPRA